MKNDERMIREVRKRLKDYELTDPLEERRKLVEAWRSAHPEASAETSSYMKPMIQSLGPESKIDRSDPDETWHNDTYYVTVRRYTKDPVFHSDGGMIQLGIAAFNGTAKHDWRDFQAIKNQLAGPECEAFELYPAESRLIDPSNYYTLWCFPGIRRIKVGMDERRVWDAEEAIAPQRALPPKAG